jgi:hypothetical protein
MEDEPCRKRLLQVRFRRSKKRLTTPSANGRSGWSYGSVNWMPTSMLGSRQFARQLLRTLTHHLQSSASIKHWMTEEEET